MTARRKRGVLQRPRQACTRADARLLELISQFRRDRARIDALDRAQDRLHFQSPQAVAINHEVNDLVLRCWRIRDAVAELPARSSKGLRAKAELAVWEFDEGGLEEASESQDFAVGWSLARDIAGRAA